MRVFISWSGSRSRALAHALKDWLPALHIGLEPWVSDHDIPKGGKWSDEIEAALSESQAGIICVTPENVRAPWLNFEAGALAKAVSKAARVCPVLLGIESNDITGPLVQFQATRANNREELTKLALSLREALVAAGASAPEPTFRKMIGLTLPELETAISSIKAPPGAKKADQRSPEEKIDELLRLVREIVRDGTSAPVGYYRSPSVTPVAIGPSVIGSSLTAKSPGIDWANFQGLDPNPNVELYPLLSPVDRSQSRAISVINTSLTAGAPPEARPPGGKAEGRGSDAVATKATKKKG